MPAVCVGWVTGRLEFPKPAGARPLSVAFPCASQTRWLLPARCDAVLPIAALDVRGEFGIAEGGRFWDSSRCRGDTAGAFGVLAGRPFIAGVSCAGTFAVPVR